MSRTLNKVQLIGRLGADPQMKYTPSGVPVTSFSLATNRQWKDNEGTQREETDWHNIVAWDRLAQTCAEYLAKGRLVYIEGRLQTRSWESDGRTNYRTEIVANDMLILDSKGAATADGTSQAQEPVAPEPRNRRQSTTPVEDDLVPAAGRQPSRSSRVAVVEPDDDPNDLPF
jgi:single-strand DNA-binding protein